MDLTRTNWQSGWIPSDDAHNGRKDGLLRMDNCYLDEHGVLSLVPGLVRANASALPGGIHTIYSRYFNNQKHRFVGLTNGSVFIDNGSGSFGELLSGGASNQACFATAFGNVLIGSGALKRKYDGEVALELGLEKPDAPGVQDSAGDFATILDTYGTVTLVDGENLQINGDHIVFDTTESAGVALVTHVGSGFFDTISRDTDTFNCPVKIGDSSLLRKVRLSFILDEDLENPINYFIKEWSNESIPSDFSQGNLAWTNLTCLRGDFERHGNDPLTWADIKGIRVEISCTGVMTGNTVTYMAFFGGENGPLTLPYRYAQVNIYNNGVYDAKSAVSEFSVSVFPKQGKVFVTPSSPLDPEVNQIWIFRISDESSTDVTRIGDPRKLDRLYRVKVLDNSSGFGGFYDLVTDDEALDEGFTIDSRIQTVKDIPDPFLGITGIINGRVLYMTFKEIIVSDFNDPDTYNPFHNIKLGGSKSERNLWIAKVSNNSVLIGTTEDIHEVTGTWEELPDGTLNITVQPLGIGFPPICSNFCIEGGYLYYLAADGWRRTNGNGSELLLGDLDLLFRGKERYGLPPVVLYPNGLAYYPCAFYKNQLWTVMLLKDGTRRIFVYDFIRKYWHLRELDPISLYTEEDGILVGGFGGGSGNYLNILDTDPTSGDDLAGINGQRIYILTVSDDNGQPRNRKDTFTFKFRADTGGETVRIYLGKDGTPGIFVGTFSSNGYAEQLYEINAEAITLGKRYQVGIVGEDINHFRLYGFTIEYEPRPEQLNYLRIPATNLGTLARKRFTNYALVIDTLGANVNLTPYVDNLAKTASVVNKATKLTHVHYFAEETLGTDIGGILSSPADSPFEYYGLNLEEIVSEKLPTPTTFLVIPSSDYGNPNRKRHSAYKFQINTRGQNVRFTPRLDGVDLTPLVFSTSEKRTVEHFFTSDTIGIDIGGKLESLTTEPFEFYGVIIPQEIEMLPPRLTYFVIPANDYGNPNRKRHSSYKLLINTNGADVLFVPRVDGVDLAPSTINTSEKLLHEHYFTVDTFGRVIGGTLIAQTTTPFEFYGVIIPQQVEVLPPRLKFFRIPENNYGIPAKKRVRTMPMEINTNGNNVVFTPIVDGVLGTPTTINTPTRQTAFHYFNTDVFGIDFSGTLEGDNPFEFYGLLKPEEVEILPVGKLFDQLGPMDYSRIAKLQAIRVKMIATGLSVPFRIFVNDVEVYDDVFTTIPDRDKVYEAMRFPKTIFGDVFRIELGPTSTPFHRYFMEIKVNQSGMDTNNKWVKIR